MSRQQVNDLLKFIVLAILSYIIIEILLDAVFQKLERSILFVVCLVLIGVLVFLELPDNTLPRIKRHLEGMLLHYLIPPNPDVFRSTFDFDGENVHIIYTCRKRIDGQPCPEYDEPLKNRHLNHTNYLHIPADEFVTTNLMFMWYKNQIRSVGREGPIRSFSCTQPFDDIVKKYIRGQMDTANIREDIPDFAYDNLIIVGENSLSELFLEKLKPILNFYPKLIKEGPFDLAEGQSPLARAVFHLSFFANNRNTIGDSDSFLLYTSFDPDKPNALALIYYAPNPFNVQKKVLILYGCHRVGQYLLEDWLQTPDAARFLRNLRRDQPNPIGQIVIRSSFLAPKHAENYEFRKTHLIKNQATNQPFFPFVIPSKRISQDGFGIDEAALQRGGMVDISLVIELPRHQADFLQTIESYFLDRPDLQFLASHFREAQGHDPGLHVTLYEFATHKTQKTLQEGIEHFDELSRLLGQTMISASAPMLHLAGFDVFPTAIVLYADLPSQFVDQIGEACHRMLPESAYLNRRRVPFPLHCTLFRFSKPLSAEEQQRLRLLADVNAHRRSFGQLQVRTLSLLLTRRQPYQEVDSRFEIQLR